MNTNTQKNGGKKSTPNVPAVAPKAKQVKKGEKAQLVMTGYEEKVDLLVEKKQEIEAATGVLTTGRGELDPLVTKFRQEHETDGEYNKTVIVKGSKINACYTFKDAYAKIDVSVEGDLQRLLGGEYNQLFVRRHEVAVKDGAMDKLLELAKQHGFVDLLQQDEWIEPVAGFREVRADKRAALSSDQNKALDEVVVQVAAKPALSFK